MRERSRPKLNEYGMATRADIRFDTDAERLCRITLGLVESMGASEALTNAVIHLDKARDFIADHVEREPPKDYRTMICCEVSPHRRAEDGCSQCKPLAKAAAAADPVGPPPNVVAATRAVDDWRDEAECQHCGGPMPGRKPGDVCRDCQSEALSHPDPDPVGLPTTDEPETEQ